MTETKSLFASIVTNLQLKLFKSVFKIQLRRALVVCWDSAVVPEELSPEAAALAQAETEADAQANDSDQAADAHEGLIDPTREGANSSFFRICKIV